MAAPTLLLLLLLGALLAPSAARAPAAKASAAPTVQVTVGVLLPERDLRLPWALQRVAPALSLALEALQPQLRLDGISVRTAFASSDEDDRCDEKLSLFKAAELRGSHDPDVLLGLGCLDDGYSLRPFLRYWRLPLLLAAPYRSSVGVPEPEVVYAGSLGGSLLAFQTRLFQHFNWTRRAVMAVSRDRDCNQNPTSGMQ